MSSCDWDHVAHSVMCVEDRENLSPPLFLLFCLRPAYLSQEENSESGGFLLRKVTPE